LHATRNPSVAILAVDAHAHVMRRNAPLAPERHSAPKRDVTVDEFLGVLDEHAISHGVLTAPSFYGTDNSLLLEALDAHPDRLRGTVIVAPEIDDSTLRAMAGGGVVGIRLNWVRRDALPDVTSSAYRSLLARVRDLNWHVEILLEGAKLAAVLPRLRETGARVVVDHFGLPDPARGIACEGFAQVLEGVRSGDTFVKLSAPYRFGETDPQRYVDALLDAGGPRQLVWASDWPFVSFEDEIRYAQCVHWIRTWIPDEAARRTVLVDTPAALFAFDREPRRHHSQAS
jgi:predicted TIM-barrel fold metal-dependent hydrolase